MQVQYFITILMNISLQHQIQKLKYSNKKEFY